MNKEFYKSRKFWTALVTAIAAIVAFSHSEELAALLTFVGVTLIGGVALEDHGKAKAAIYVHAEKDEWDELQRF